MYLFFGHFFPHSFPSKHIYEIFEGRKYLYQRWFLIPERISWAWKKKNKSADVTLTPSVCPLIDHGQQPMEMHREVTLLYNISYLSRFAVLWKIFKSFFQGAEFLRHKVRALLYRGILEVTTREVLFIRTSLLIWRNFGIFSKKARSKEGEMTHVVIWQ